VRPSKDADDLLGVSWPSRGGLCGFFERALAAFFYELLATEVSEEHYALIP
jgi:hypothetical protein